MWLTGIKLTNISERQVDRLGYKNNKRGRHLNENALDTSRFHSRAGPNLFGLNQISY